MVAYWGSIFLTMSCRLFRRRKSPARNAQNPRSFYRDSLEPAAVRMSTTCTRVAVLEGHTESALVLTQQQASVPEVRSAWERFGQEFVQLGLPSSPRQFIVAQDDPFRPQPRLDRDTDDGMATTVGRLRADTAFANGMQYVLVSHNTKMGAAKGAVLTAGTAGAQRVYRCMMGLRGPGASSHRSASMAAIHPLPAAVIAWRYTLSTISPAANTPSTLVTVVPGLAQCSPGRRDRVAHERASNWGYGQRRETRHLFSYRVFRSC